MSRIAVKFVMATSDDLLTPISMDGIVALVQEFTRRKEVLPVKFWTLREGEMVLLTVRLKVTYRDLDTGFDSVQVGLEAADGCLMGTGNFTIYVD